MQNHPQIQQQKIGRSSRHLFERVISFLRLNFFIAAEKPPGCEGGGFSAAISPQLSGSSNFSRRNPGVF
jgi:hypothetical protein